jgi:hypothetical protein
MSFGALEDRPLLDAAKQLAADERRATATLLERVDGDRPPASLPGRRLRLDVRLLHAGAASVRGRRYNRIEAARAARTYPLLLELFEQSTLR